MIFFRRSWHAYLTSVSKFEDRTYALAFLQRGVQLFLRWAIMQGIAMHLQNRYQRQRLRTRIALGKVSLFLDSTKMMILGLYSYFVLEIFDLNMKQ
jgi:hypothetical protein